MSEELVHYPKLAEERRPNPYVRLSTARFKYWWSKHLLPFRDFEARGVFVGCSVVPVRLDAASNHQDMVESCWSDYGICTAEAREEEIDYMQSQCVGLEVIMSSVMFPPRLTPGLIVLQTILLVVLSLVFAWVVWGQEPVADGPSFPLHDALAQ